MKLEPVIARIVQKLCTQIGKHAGSGRPVTISNAFSCMTSDVVSEYAFAKSTDFLSTESPGFETNLHDALVGGSEMGLFMKNFPWIFKLLRAIPEYIRRPTFHDESRS